MKTKSTGRIMGVLWISALLAMLPGLCTAKEEKPIKIGAIVDLTGAFASYGLDFKDSITFACEQAGWKVAGRPVKLIIEDGATDPNISLDKAKKLVESDGVAIMIGPLHSGIALGIAPYLAEHKVPDIGLMAHASGLKDSGWVFSPWGPITEFGWAMGVHAHEKMGARTASVLGLDYIAGYEVLGAFARAFKDKGGDVVQRQWSPLGTMDYGAYIAATKQAEVSASWPSPVAPYVKQAAEFGLRQKTKLIVPYAEMRESELNELGSAVLGVKGAAPYTWRLDNPANKKFVAAIETKFGRKPTLNDMAGYEACLVALAALEATKGDTGGDALYKALLGLKLELPSGPVSFTPSRWGLRNTYILEAKDMGGKIAWDVVDTYRLNPDEFPPIDKNS